MHVINDQNYTDYGEGNENGTTIKFETKVIKSSLYDYSDAYILVTGNIAAADGNPDTRVALRNCAPFAKYVTHINDEDVDGNREVKMYMYNLIEYSDNYWNATGSLWQFNGDEQNMNNGNPANFTTADS